MTDIQIILKLNKEINDYIEGQRKSLANYEREVLIYEHSNLPKSLIEKNKKLVEILYFNLEALERERDKILGLERN